MKEEIKRQEHGVQSNTKNQKSEKKPSLWDKMWEEYVESVSARRQRRKKKKEKRMAKQQEKLRKFAGKKISFAGFFVRAFLPILLFTVMLCMVGTVIVYHNIERAVQEEVYGVGGEIQAELYTAYNKLYDPEALVSYDEDWILDTKWNMFIQAVTYEDSCKMALYDVSDMASDDISDMPKVLDSSQILRIGVVLDEEKEETVTCFSEGEPFKEVMEEYEWLENTYPEKSFALELEDCYIKGKKFLPGKVFIVDENGEKIAPRKGVAEDKGEAGNVTGFDLTPENTEGYTHIYAESNRIYGPAWIGRTTSMNVYDRWFDKLQANESIEGVKNTFLNYDGGSREWKDGTDECIMLFTKCSSEDEGIPDLLLITFCNYNIIEMYGKWALGIYVGIFVLAVILSLILAYRSHFQYEAQNLMNQYRRDMTNAMAHDLKSPLMVVSGYAENLRDNVHMEKKDYYAEAILENVQYMNEIIHNILHLSKIESGAGKLQKTEVELKSLTEVQLHKYEGCIEDKGLEISVDFANAGCIWADENLMAQVVDNLLNNAVKYTQEQGQISVEAGANYYEVRNSLEEALGVDAMQLWKPFVKGDNSRGNEQGSGIGLTIVKNIVEQHGFRLELFEEDRAFVARIHF